MKNLIFLIVLSIISFSCSKVEQKDNFEVNVIIVSFIEEISKENTEEAIVNLFATNKLISSSVDQVNNVVSMFSDEISNKGRYIDFEVIKKSAIGSDIEYYSIVFKYEHMPIRVSIVIYKPVDKWILFDFAYDSDFLDELFETGKAYRLLKNIEY